MFVLNLRRKKSEWIFKTFLRSSLETNFSEVQIKN